MATIVMNTLPTTTVASRSATSPRTSSSHQPLISQGTHADSTASESKKTTETTLRVISWSIARMVPEEIPTFLTTTEVSPSKKVKESSVDIRSLLKGRYANINQSSVAMGKYWLLAVQWGTNPWRDRLLLHLTVSNFTRMLATKVTKLPPTPMQMTL